MATASAIPCLNNLCGSLDTTATEPYGAESEVASESRRGGEDDGDEQKLYQFDWRVFLRILLHRLMLKAGTQGGSMLE